MKPNNKLKDKKKIEEEKESNKWFYKRLDKFFNSYRSGIRKLIKRLNEIK